jgi:xanthosine utilization system XapX-like protein
MTETPNGMAVRRCFGALCVLLFLVGFLVTAGGLVLNNRSPIGPLLFLFGALGPYLGMILHLNLTQLLTATEKTLWRSQLVTSSTSFGAVFTYLLSKDLRGATARLEGQLQQ